VGHAQPASLDEARAPRAGVRHRVFAAALATSFGMAAAAASASFAAPAAASVRDVATASTRPADGVPVAAPSPVLFRGAHVVTMHGPEVLRERDVLVVDGRVARIAPRGRLRAPRDATSVDARGRWLMPGLAEMHAHVPAPPPAETRSAQAEQYAHDVLLLYAAHGITTIRGMLGHPWHLALRDDLRRGAVLGPRLHTAGPSLNGNTAPDPVTGVRLVREQKAAGYDFLKLHPGLGRATFDAIVATANEVGLRFEGHVADDVGLLHALDARMPAIDHLDGYLQALADPDCLKGPTSPGFFGIGLVQCADRARIPELVARTRAAGTWMAPTQVLLEQWANAPTEAELRARPAVLWLPPNVVDQWVRARGGFLALQAVGPERAAAFVRLRRELIRELHRAGVPILLAADAPQVFNVPGDSVHGELATYVASGLSPYDALATGTVNAARFLGAGDRRGRVAEGYDADLVLLAANPLDDVANARRIEGVMLAGRWLPRAELDRRLGELAARHAAVPRPSAAPRP
jgi:imidazolonepropionase-like amidohydrolase